MTFKDISDVENLTFEEKLYIEYGSATCHQEMIIGIINSEVLSVVSYMDNYIDQFQYDTLPEKKLDIKIHTQIKKFSTIMIRVCDLSVSFQNHLNAFFRLINDKDNYQLEISPDMKTEISSLLKQWVSSMTFLSKNSIRIKEVYRARGELILFHLGNTSKRKKLNTTKENIDQILASSKELEDTFSSMKQQLEIHHNELSQQLSLESNNSLTR